MAKCTYSSRGPQHPCLAVYNCLWIQLQASNPVYWPPWALTHVACMLPDIDSTYMWIQIITRIGRIGKVPQLPQSQEHTVVVWEISEGFEDAYFLILHISFHLESWNSLVLYTLIPSLLGFLFL